MKVYSWNVYCYNKKITQVCNFIQTLDFDVLCLQEVTPGLLEKLKKLPYEIAYHIDVIRLYSPKKEELNYVVILSRHEMIYRGTLQFPDIPFPLHTRIFVRVMSRFGWSLITERGSVYADIRIKDKVARVFSTHLTLWGPGNRAEEFEVLMKFRKPETPTIIGGDFNVIESPPHKIISWLLGSPVREALPWYPERAVFEERFRKHGFKNPHRAQVTHNFSRSQLDHILISKDLKTTRAWVHPDLHGSDHYPVGVEIVFPD
ncbi:MAG TPA: endonuclease/exonuclease/phosphatase family protein [Candidatus Paceibacterota bacterium]|nr:endonuclease/exonuclease/phosphatase family protein [Candidatus Paceibacterota bacterium]